MEVKQVERIDFLICEETYYIRISPEYPVPLLAGLQGASLGIQTGDSWRSIAKIGMV